MTQNNCILFDLFPPLDQESVKELLKFYEDNSTNFLGYRGVNTKGVVDQDSNGNPIRVFNPDRGFAGYKFNSNNDKFVKSILEKNNIKLQYSEVSFVIQRIQDYNLPHIDPGRYFGILYHLTGTATTRFFDKVNGKLELIESHRTYANTWYIFNHSALHAVNDIENNLRVSLAIEFPSFKSFQEGKEKFMSVIQL